MKSLRREEQSKMADHSHGRLPWRSYSKRVVTITVFFLLGALPLFLSPGFHYIASCWGAHIWTVSLMSYRENGPSNLMALYKGISLFLE